MTYARPRATPSAPREGSTEERRYTFTIHRMDCKREIRQRRMTQPESARYLSWLAGQPWTYSATCVPEIPA